MPTRGSQVPGIAHPVKLELSDAAMMGMRARHRRRDLNYIIYKVLLKCTSEKLMHEFTEKLGMIFANFLNMGVPLSQTKRILINISGEKG